MLFAIGLAWHDGCATEIELFRSGFSFRPRAHARTECFQTNNHCRFWFLLDGRSTFRQPQPMHFAYNGVLSYPKAISNLAGREAFVPEGDQRADAFWCPFLTHFLCYSPRGRCSQIQPTYANISSFFNRLKPAETANWLEDITIYTPKA